MCAYDSILFLFQILPPEILSCTNLLLSLIKIFTKLEFLGRKSDVVVGYATFRITKQNWGNLKMYTVYKETFCVPEKT